MIQTPVLAANWKMYKGPAETRTFLESFLRLYPAQPDRTVVFFPPAISVAAFLEATKDRRDIETGVQDVHGAEEGAHTGAISAAMAVEAGVGWGLAGHSERRAEFGDDDDAVSAKLTRLLEATLQPVLCVGETLGERREGRLEGVLRRRMDGALDGLGAETAWRDVVVAYEPVWAIGTGETATPDDAAEAHLLIRQLLAARLPDDAEEAVILYGGSVKPENITTLLAAEGVDGVLVGGASLDPESFASICRVGTLA
jgi:triosephosphate isomerase